MPTDKELMQLALDALESVFEGDDKGAEYWTVTGGTYEAVECMQIMRALKSRLAQPEPEPVAWVAYETGEKHGVDFDEDEIAELPVGTMLYTAPPQREWQGLTENEIKHLWYEACQINLELTSQLIVHLARNIEAKLKEKNT